MYNSTRHLPPEAFVEEAKGMLLRTRRSKAVGDRRFRGLFGTTPAVCSRLWFLVLPNAPEKSRPADLLWALLFLKVYACEYVNAIVAGVDEKTFRKWSWCFVKLLSEVKQVRDLYRLLYCFSKRF